MASAYLSALSLLTRKYMNIYLYTCVCVVYLPICVRIYKRLPTMRLPSGVLTCSLVGDYQRVVKCRWDELE